MLVRKRALKAVLMDQTLMAGIGNIYSDEILFQARLHPRTPADCLRTSEIKRLFKKAKGVLETAIAREAGSEQFLEHLPAGYVLPHRERGGHCPSCGEAIATT